MITLRSLNPSPFKASTHLFKTTPCMHHHKQPHARRLRRQHRRQPAPAEGDAAAGAGAALPAGAAAQGAAWGRVSSFWVVGRRNCVLLWVGRLSVLSWEGRSQLGSSSKVGACMSFLTPSTTRNKPNPILKPLNPRPQPPDTANTHTGKRRRMQTPTLTPKRSSSSPRCARRALCAARS